MVITMLHKLGYDTICEQCNKPKRAEEMREDDMCEDCGAEWSQKEAAYWKPLYDAEQELLKYESEKEECMRCGTMDELDRFGYCVHCHDDMFRKWK